MDIMKKTIAPVPYEIFDRLQPVHREPKIPKLRRAGALDRHQPSGQRIYSWNNNVFQAKVRDQGKSRPRSWAARSGVGAVAVHKTSEG
jgi:hypothetical protein